MTGQKTDKPNLALIGCGKMGGAMLRGWIESGIADRITVLEPYGLPDEFRNEPSINEIGSAELLPQSDIVILAVKPQIMQEVCETIAPKMAPDTLILSIAAGQTIGNFERHFGTEQPVIRAMPNTPAAIGQGMTIAVANRVTSDKQKETATKLLESIGFVEWATDEAIMDAVTALSGSGPAYLFHLIEAMAEAGTNCGLEPDFAMSLARQTVIGSAALAASEPETSASQLRQNVTSPGGTTEAALNVLMAEMPALFTRALKAATARSKELS